MSQSQDDTDLWTEWNREHGRAVWGYVWGMLRRHDLADDLTQDVFCRAWQGRSRYTEQGKARAYLLQIADRLVLDYFRKAKREVNLSEAAWKQIEPAHQADSPGDTAGREETMQQLAATLDRLSPHQRRVLLLRYYGELPFAEIAEIMECPLSTALSHCHRGLRTLRSLLVETAK